MRANWGCSYSLLTSWRNSRRGCGPKSSQREHRPGRNLWHISISRQIKSYSHCLESCRWFITQSFAFFIHCGLSLCLFNHSTPPLSYSLHHPPFSAIFRLNLCLGEGINVAVGIYSTAVLARKPSASRLYRETNEPVHSKTRTFHTQTGSLLLPSEIKKAQVAAVSLYAHFDFVSSKCVLRKI